MILNLQAQPTKASCPYLELTDSLNPLESLVQTLRVVATPVGLDLTQVVDNQIDVTHVAVHELEWDEASGVARLVFLIADAPPHMDYADDFDYRDEAQLAAQSGIVVHAIGARSAASRPIQTSAQDGAGEVK